MKIVIEFYRTRDTDDAHAVVGREMLKVADLDDAIGGRATPVADARHAAATRRHDDY